MTKGKTKRGWAKALLSPACHHWPFEGSPDFKETNNFVLEILQNSENYKLG